MHQMQFIYIFSLALLLDLALGEPPNRFHPVAWLGKLINLQLKFRPQKGSKKQLGFGATMVLLTAGITTAAVLLLLNAIEQFNQILFIVIAAIVLKLTLSLRGLIKAADSVKKLLQQNAVEKSRLSLQALVSRDTSQLENTGIISATIESVAENSCDSFLAPLFYFLLFGVPGAVAYRITNTFDAMIGYRGEWEYTGKFAARLDDIANFIPARISAMLLVASAWICKRNARQSWNIMLRDHNKTSSPNAGWTMCAMAGALNIGLEKTGEYKLGNNQSDASVLAIDHSQEMTWVLAAMWSAILLLVQGVILVAG
jgi:adenosylcobinamide-phosphate synthase